MPAPVVALAAFLSILFLLLSFAHAFEPRMTLKEKLNKFSHHMSGENEGEEKRQMLLSTLVKALPKSLLEKKEADLKEADIPLYAAEFIGIQLLIFLIVVLLTALINMWLSLPLGFAAALSPNMVTGIKKRKRQSLLDEQLIDALSIMTSAVKAGYSLQQAMKMAAGELSDPLHTLFSDFLNDLSMGVPFYPALESMAKKSHNADIELMTVALGINRQVGGSMADILDAIQNTIIGRIRLKKQIRVLTAQGRLSGLIIEVLPVAVGIILFLIDPSYMLVMFKNPMGISILTVSALLMATGIYVMQKIVNVRV